GPFPAENAASLISYRCEALQCVSSCRSDARRDRPDEHCVRATKLVATPATTFCAVATAANNATSGPRYHNLRIWQQRCKAERVLGPEEAPGLVRLQLDALAQLPHPFPSHQSRMAPQLTRAD